MTQTAVEPLETGPVGAAAPDQRQPTSGPALLGRLFDYALEGACVVLLLGMVVATLLQVFFRYVLNAPLSWPEELSRWFFVWLIYVGMAVAIQRGSHISIDLPTGLLSPLARRALALAAHTAMAMTAVALVVHGWDLADRASVVSPALEWNTKYLYLAVPVGGGLSLYYLLRQRVFGERVPISGVLSVLLGGVGYLIVSRQASALFAGWSNEAILVGSGLLLLLLGVPIGFALALSSFFAFWTKGALFALTVPQNMATSADSFVLLAIPFFMVAGGLMNSGGITERLVGLATALVGHLRGGLGQVNVVASTLLGGISGSASAQAAGITKILVPAMERRGYDRPFACGLTASSSIVDNLIPPSIPMLIYGALASVSIGSLFLAGIVPGILMAGALMLVVYVMSARRGYGADRPRASAGEMLRAFRGASPALLMPLIIVVGIRFGVFTATEAGAIAVLYAAFAGAVFYRGLSWRALPQVLRESVSETVVVMFIIAASAPFAWVLVIEQVPQTIAQQLGNLATNPLLLLLLINIFLLLVGLPLELAPAMVILVPILLPMITQAGIDPIHFGVIMIINLMLGSLTPPIGVLIFVTAHIARVPATKVFSAALPFLMIQILVLAVVTFIPDISLFLPRVLGPR